MKKKKIKIKWGNVVKLIISLFCIGVILHDFYYLTFKFGMLTWFGVTTHILCWLIVGFVWEDFEEQNKNIHSYQPKHAKDI